ncbi:MAG TPA: GNAT family N-acetyltransferase [Fimbriimonadaceae bacterium]|nr:GNAT family N-acetyltransferase [Fimbriimonadaceae bacterium]
MDWKWVKHGSDEYWSTVDLRRRVLRIPLGLDFSETDLAGEVGDGHLAGLEGSAALACLVMTPKGDGTVKMRQVAVDPALQGKGLGRNMVAESERWARAQGFREIVLSARESAVPFYLRLGYAIDGDPFEEVSLPHFLMRKPL